LGDLKFRGIGLGTAGVLFAGILAGQLGEAVDPRTLDFVKDFGLILFVFTLSLQLGRWQSFCFDEYTNSRRGPFPFETQPYH
jgi:uncharacterized transporter YbjL